MCSYPASERKAYFAFRFTRLMAKTCVAQEVGPLGCWLLTTIAMTEDASRYRRAVTWYDHQLTPLLGCSQDAMARARKKCVEAGWLHYEPGSKCKAGKYWVIVPQHADGMPDTPTDENDIRPQKPDESATNSGIILESSLNHQRQTAVPSATNSGSIPATIIPIPKNPDSFPVPPPVECRQAGDEEPVTDKELSETPGNGPIDWPSEFADLCELWQACKQGIGGVCHFAGLPHPSMKDSRKTYMLGWNMAIGDRDRLVFKNTWPKRKAQVIEAIKAINAGAIQWELAPLAFHKFPNEIDAIIGGGHARHSITRQSVQPKPDYKTSQAESMMSELERVLSKSNSQQSQQKAISHE